MQPASESPKKTGPAIEDLFEDMAEISIKIGRAVINKEEKRVTTKMVKNHIIGVELANDTDSSIKIIKTNLKTKLQLKIVKQDLVKSSKQDVKQDTSNTKGEAKNNCVVMLKRDQCVLSRCIITTNVHSGPHDPLFFSCLATHTGLLDTLKRKTGLCLSPAGPKKSLNISVVMGRVPAAHLHLL